MQHAPAAHIHPTTRWLSRCATPRVGGWSAYTLLGLIGYVVSSVLVGALSWSGGVGLGERLVIQLVPPLSLLLVATITRLRRGKERMVFYRVATTAVLAAMFVAAATRLDVAVVTDHVVTGIAVFQVFGRLGCFHVACCFGRVSRWGVRYGAAHAEQGLARRFVGRPLLPVQLFEAAVGAGLAVACAALLGHTPGAATCVFTLGYAIARFTLELLRGDAARPVARGLSEAQWFAVLSSLGVAALDRSWMTVTGAACLSLAAIAVAILHGRPGARLSSPQHVDEIARVHDVLLEEGSGALRTTTEGFKISLHVLPDLRFDLIWSHPELDADATRAIATALFTAFEVIPARAASTFHVLVPVDVLAPRRRDHHVPARGTEGRAKA